MSINTAVFFMGAGVFSLVLGGCVTSPPPAEPTVAPVAAERDAEIRADSHKLEAQSPAPVMTSAEPLEVTVLETIFLALENNRALRIQRLTPPILQTLEEVERAIFDPVVSADIIARHEKSRTRAGDTVHDTGIGAAAGASVFLPTGTSVGGELATDRFSVNALSDRHVSRAGVTVTQALLRDFGRGANLASLQQARLDTRRSEYELRGFAETLVATVETTYWDYVLALRQVEIYQESMELAEKQLHETEVRIRVGDVAETERAAAQAEVALRREGLINAHSRVDILQVRLLRLMAPAQLSREERKIIPVSQPTIPNDGMDDLKDHVALALRMRPEINQARLLVQRGNFEIVKTRNGLLPRMDLFITLGKTGYAQSFGRSVADIIDDGYDVSAGVLFQFPVANRAARARHNAAGLNQQQFEESVFNIEDLIREEVESAFIEVNRARRQVDATAATRRFQEEKLRAEMAKFNADKSTALLVATAQRDLLVSRVAEVEAMTTYLKALTNFHFFEGSLLKRRGIAAPGEVPQTP